MGFEAQGTEVTTPNGKKYVLYRWYENESGRWIATEINHINAPCKPHMQIIALTVGGQWVNHHFLKDSDIRQYWMNSLKKGEQEDCRTKAEQTVEMLMGVE